MANLAMSPGNDVQVLEVHECWALLRSSSLGRVGVATGDGGVDIFPVNIVVDHGTLVFRTATGTKLDLIDAASRVCVEADHTDPETGIAWSVVAQGPADVVSARSDLWDAFGLEVDPWQVGRKPFFVRVTPTSLTGRRFQMRDRGSASSIGRLLLSE